MNNLASTQPPYWVRIHMPSGIPGGLRVIEKSNWSGDGAFFSRSIYPEIRAQESFDFDRTGVYVLWEPPGDSSTLPRVYIGEADPLRPRLDQQMKQKDFWTSGVAFSAKDASLNKAHVKHLESRLIQRARDLRRCRLENGNSPQLPNLSAADRTLADAYWQDMMLCLPVLGVDFFEPPSGIHEHDLLEATSAGIHAKAYEDSFEFVVRKGSHAKKGETRTIQRYLSELRRELLSQGILLDKGGFYEFTEDYHFSSPSTAAGVVFGRSANGRTTWKDAAGRTLRELQAQRVAD